MENLNIRLRGLDFIGYGKIFESFGQGSEEICVVF